MLPHDHHQTGHTGQQDSDQEGAMPNANQTGGPSDAGASHSPGGIGGGGGASGGSYAAPGGGHTGSGLFSWMRGLGMVRENAWLGGVCGGIAARLGIDPIIVRGVVVVVALLGGPAFLFYAAAWALMPDTQDRIHLERMLRGIFDPASIAIIVMAALTFLPIAQGVWWTGGSFWLGSGVLGGIFKAIWSLLVVAAIIVFIIWAARGFPRAPWEHNGHPDRPRGYPSSGSAGPAGNAAGPGGTTGSSAAAPGASSYAAAAGTAPHAGGAPADSFGSVPVPDGTGASAAAGDGSPADDPTRSSDLADWQQRQAAWRAERDAWRAQQTANRNAARDRRSVEYRAAAEQAAAREEARRLDRLENPRTSARFVWAAIGLALVAGAVVGGVAANEPDTTGFSPTIGFAAATAVFGIASVVAALTGRRGGFLGFLGLVMLALTVLSPFTGWLGESSGWHDIIDTSWVNSTVTTVQTTVKELL